MPESVNTYRYLSYLGSRWRFIVAPCLIAAFLALVVSLLEPKQYTAACRILIEPAAGGAMVSPMYLESLKTYEQFAASDSLFMQAIDHFRLRQRFPQQPVESLKARILKVGMVRDTKILEINATLSDPKTAHALALYVADQTVALSRAVGDETEKGDVFGAGPGERLQIIDPGIVPERPTSPNVPMRVAAALLVGLVAPVIYLTLELSYRTQRAYAMRGAVTDD